MTKISARVGRNGKNVRNDVLTVRDLINQCMRLLIPRAALKTEGTCDQPMIDAISDFQRRVMIMPLPDGNVDPGGHTLEALSICASGKTYVPKAPAVKGPGTKFTDNPNEVPTRTTTPSAREVVAMARQSWPELNESGARTLAAQFMHETGGGKHCYNWNLGNVKASAKEPHMYLRGVWEVDSPAQAQAQVAKADGHAHIATAEEIKKHGWSCPEGKSVAVFEPPHAQCRFRAYATLQEGAQKWVAHHQSTASKQPDFLKQLNAGDCAGAAKTLKKVHYYTGGEADYARSMTSIKARIDAELGPA